MTPLYVDAAAGCQKGIGAAETGIKIESISFSAEDPRIDTRDHQGARDGFVHAYDQSVTVSIEGEVSGSTGMAAVIFGTAATIANEDEGVGGSATDMNGVTAANYFGVEQTGGWYLNGTPTISLSREDLKKISLEFLCCPDIA